MFYVTDILQIVEALVALGCGRDPRLANALQIVRDKQDAQGRWPLEVTFEEARAHLGLETQRQWSDLAIERTTPTLLGLFSLIILLAQALYPTSNLPLPQAAWYPKTHATFHDVLALVRRRLWQQFIFQTDAPPADLRFISPLQLEHLLSAACY